MIRLQLKCLHGDYFDAWFADHETYADHLRKGQVGCPHCGEISVAEAPPLKPGLYEDLSEDQARQMACDTRRMLEAWVQQRDQRATTEAIAGALAEQAAQIATPMPEAPAPQPDAEAERPRRRAAEPKQRPVHYDC